MLHGNKKYTIGCKESLFCGAGQENIDIWQEVALS